MDARQYAPATQRNKEPILEVLSQNLGSPASILEIASGTGEHAIFFAASNRGWHWLPSDINPQARESIIAWKNSAPDATNLALPLAIDVTKSNWIEAVGDRKFDGLININMIHISPWEACLGLFDGAKEILSPGGILYLYGPFKRENQHTSTSNEQFDRSLRDRNPSWGVRDLETVVETAAQANFQLKEVIKMPANNLSVIFIKKL